MSHHSPSYAITIRLRYPDEAGQLGHITTAIGRASGFIGAVDIVNVREGLITRDITVNASDVEHGLRIVESVKQVEGVRIVNVSDRVFLLHLGGKIEIAAKAPVKTRDDLSMAYTPGVARVCRAIFQDPESSFALTIRKNTVAVVTDGSAVLGMGNIGPRAAMPVMEGKALLFKEFGGVDAFPICLDTQDPDRIEERLISKLEIPVFHDDQHGTAIVVLAGLTNALKLVDNSFAAVRIVINGAGAAGTAIAKLLTAAGAKNIVVCDRRGAIFAGRSDNMNYSKQWLAENTNPDHQTGSLSDVIRGADVFVGVSTAGALRPQDVANMTQNAIVFALANPDPEIRPEDTPGNVRVMATGRSDYPNQVNNVLCFPGLFRGVLDVRARLVNDKMKLAAAAAIAGVIEDDELHPDYIIPSVFDRRVVKVVAKAVSETALATDVARRQQKPSFQIA
ncbi:MAG: NAD-dependent malic enzyme [Planctomycetia bacterium]|nr:NAD-dependent malic enzyme [Planctomycetia bacterium]